MDSAHIVSGARSAVAAIDPNQALFSIETMEQALAVEVSQERTLSRLVGLAVPVAVLLAAAGLYGVLAGTTTRRTREIGIRMAMGANRRDVLALVLSRGLALTAIGLGGALATSPLLSPLLFQVEAFDAGVVALVSLMVAGVGLAASFLPARLAASIHPVEALRCE